MIPKQEDLQPYVYNRKEAAKKFGVTEKTIINWLKKYDMYQPRENFGCGKLNFEKAFEIRKEYKTGSSMKVLSQKYNVTLATISRVVHNLIYREKHEEFAKVNVIYNITGSSGSLDVGL